MTSPRIATIVLAAGSSTRMPEGHKLLEIIDGRPIVEWAVQAAVDSGTDPVVVVTGHRAEDVEEILPAGATVLRSPDFSQGLSASLRCGLEALPPEIEAVVVALGDMPFVRARHHRALIGAWRPGSIVVPKRDGRRGHPVVWSASFFDEMATLSGDQGAKSIAIRHPEAVIEVAALDDAGFVDIDDAGDLERARAHDS